MPNQGCFLHKVIFFVIVMFLVSGISHASFISLSNTLDSFSIGVSGTSYAKISINNYGDEAAKNVRISLLLPDGFSSKTIYAGDIRNGGSYSGSFEIKSQRGVPGSYTTAMLIEYEDSNGYALSAVSPGKFSCVSYYSSSVYGSMGESSIVEKGSGDIEINIFNEDSVQRVVSVKLFMPNELSSGTVEKSAIVKPGEKASVVFTITNNRGLIGSVYPIFASIDYLDENHHSSYASGMVKIEKRDYIPIAIILILFLLSMVVIANTKHRERKWKFSPVWREIIVAVIVLIAIIGFLLTFFEPRLLFSPTHISAGDTVGHYYGMYYLNKVLIPQGEIIGWCPNWFMGYPMFQFYFPLVFTIGALLGYVPGIALPVAFKIISCLGVFLLPVGVFLCFRKMNFEFPIPIIAALFTLPFLFMENQSMWGGNIPSTLAGEFAYVFSLSIMIILMGSLYSGIKEGKHVLMNSVLFALIVISHIFPAMFAVGASTFFLFDRKNLKKNFIYLAKVFGIGLLLCSFWLIPMAFKTAYTVPHMWYLPGSMGEIWKMIFTADEGKFFPLPIFAIIALAGLGLSIWKKDNKVHYLAFCASLAFVGMLASGTLSSTGITVFRQLQFIKFIPIMYLFIFLTAATTFGFLSRIRARWIIPLLAALIIFIYVSSGTTYVKYWIEWNYSGYENKKAGEDYFKANDFLATLSNGRVVFEYDPDKYDSTLGSSRATETIPAFSGRPITEGTHFQSAFSGPYIYYAHCEYSNGCSCLFGPETGGCSGFNMESATEHLKLFNVKQLFVSSDKLKQALQNDDRYKMLYGPGTFEIWELETHDGSYVTIPKYEPVLVSSDDWRNISYAWFKNYEYNEVPLVFDKSAEASRDFELRFNSLDMSQLPMKELDANCSIEESVSRKEVKIKTTCIGKPLLVKISYFPNWQVEGAEKVYMASPTFMMIIPRQENVRLYYGWTWSDILGTLMTISGFVIIFIHISGKYAKNKILKKIDNMIGIQ